MTLTEPEIGGFMGQALLGPGRWPRRVPFFEGYLDWRDSEEAAVLRESGATTDFANYLAAVIGKRLMITYREVSAVWQRYTNNYDLPDFKPISFTGIGESPDLLPFEEGGTYLDSPLAQRAGPTLTLDTFGRLFSITRKALINDDLGQLRDQPARFGRAAGRTLSRSIVKKLESNPLAYDGTALFDPTHGNLLTGAGNALSETALGAADTLLGLQTDDQGNPIDLQPYLILIPRNLVLTLRRILQSTNVVVTGMLTAASPATTVGETNVMQGYADFAVERYLTDPNDWYVFANPAEAPVIAVGFLNGVQNPAIMLRDPGMILVLGGGGRDPYSMEFDEVVWKVRHDWGTAIIDWRGAVKASVP
jgi:hypothetical protein